MSRLFFTLFFLAFLFFGCADKNAEINVRLEQAIVSTKKIRIEAEDKSALLLTATYMNNIKKYSSEENDIIILSYYYSPSIYEDKYDLPKPKVKINGKIAEANEIGQDEKIVKDLPSGNAWSRYYLILSEKNSAENVDITVEIYPFPTALLMIPKEF